MCDLRTHRTVEEFNPHVLEVLENFPVGPDDPRLVVVVTVLAAELNYEWAYLSQVCPGHRWEQVVFDLVVKASVQPCDQFVHYSLEDPPVPQVENFPVDPHVA